MSGDGEASGEVPIDSQLRLPCWLGSERLGEEITPGGRAGVLQSDGAAICNGLWWPFFRRTPDPYLGELHNELRANSSASLLRCPQQTRGGGIGPAYPADLETAALTDLEQDKLS